MKLRILRALAGKECKPGPNPKDRNPTAEDTLKAIEKILDDHTDYEGPMPGTGDYVGGVDPGALDLIVDLLRPKR